MGERTWYSLARELELTFPPVEEEEAVAQDRLGRYEIVGELGRGGMGQVLLAVDPEIGREVAIKVLFQVDERHRARLQRFIAEARITGQLEHPNIVPLYDVGVHDDGRIFYVMKRIFGESLHGLLSRGAPGWTQARLLGAFAQVCDAVAYAHHQGVLHRDLKLGNIMVGDFGEVLVVDWGLATLIRAGLSVELPLEGVGIVGTPGYIAPELIRRPEANPRPASDQWSLGAILYRLLCGWPAIPGRGREVLQATVAGPPLDVRLRDPDREVPDGIGEICMRALYGDPAYRFESVADMGQAVREYLEGSQRRERALAAVAEADALQPVVEEKRARAAAFRGEARQLMEAIKPSDPVEKKEPAWALEDRAAELEREAGLDEIQRLGHLRGALERVPDLHAAHVRLAQHHRAQLEAAEARRDPVAAAREEWLLRRHDRGHHRRWLDRPSRLTLITDPPGARVTLTRFVSQRRRLVEVEPRDLGVTPIVELRLAPGSYMLSVQAEGCAPVRYPVYMARGEDWHGVPPGEREPFAIRLPRAGELGPDDIYVPAGWFIAGGDPSAPDSLSRRRVWVDALVMKRFPVTNGEYLAFLNGLAEAGRGDDAERFVPRDVTMPRHPLEGTPTFGWDGRVYCRPEHTDPRQWRRKPVDRITLEAARAFAATSRAARLPNELEWEKAARGVDCRFFPWGDEHDPAFACMGASQALPQAMVVGSRPVDASVYGVRDLAGNVRDLCDNEWSEEGPAAEGERLAHIPASPSAEFVSSRGGSYSSQSHLTRCATRFGDPFKVRYRARGFRLVYVGQG